MIPHKVIPLAVAMMVIGAGPALAQFNNPFAQGAAPASGGFPSSGAAPMGGFPSGGAAPLGGMGVAPRSAGPSDDCMGGFAPLKAEAERRGKAMQALMGGGSAHRPTAVQGCSALTAFAGAMQKMAKYVEANSARCSIPPEVGVQIKEQHSKLESQRKQVCEIAQQQKNGGGRAPTLSDLLSSSAAPEAGDVKKGATFETLNGNVLTHSYSR